jgi:serine/threonine-protein kinase
VTPQSGDRLGRYQILCPIASGGMATVYAARVLGEGAFQKPVALKLMLAHLARDEKFVAMFMDEAALAANIQSPYVVATYDLGREGDETLYMALEMVLGRTLRELGDAAESAGKAMPLDVALTILVQAALGLEDAHRAKNSSGEPLDLVHRDISPHNVLVGLDGRARISDFGIARAIARTSQTETGELKGKLAYFSPEQLRGQPLDQRSDVFALGIVAWELLAGKRLFEADNPLALADRIANAPIRHLDTVRKDLPAGAAAAIAAALVRDPEKRLTSAGALAERLAAAMAAGGMSQASPARVGEIVRSLGGDKLIALESRIATVIREVPLPPSPSATGGHAALRAPVSVPPPGTTTTASGTGTGMVIVRRGPSPIVLAVAAVLLASAGAGAVFFAMRREQNAQIEAAQRAAANGPSAASAPGANPARSGHDENADTSAGIATTPPIVERLAEGEVDGGAAGALADDVADGDETRRDDRAARRRRDAQREAAAQTAAATPVVAAPVVTPPPATPVVPARGGGIVGVDEFDVDEGNR